MKIFYLQGDFPFCYFYRGYLPGVYSNQTVVSEFLRKDSDVSKADLVGKANRADVVVFQRPSSKPSIELAKLLKKNGKKVIFDNDDTYEGIPLERLDNQKQIDVAEMLRKNLIEFMKIADGCTASTEVLATEYRKYNPNVAVLKNCIDPMDDIGNKENKTGKFRVGFIGSVTSNDDYIHIKDQIKRLDERGDVTIVIMGVKLPDGEIMPSMQPDADFWGSLKNVEWHKVVHVTEYMGFLSDLALDVAIIPRKDHYFNKCKSNLKFLEMSLLRIPVIAQGFEDGTSPYQGVDSEYMTVVLDNDTWYNKIIEVKEKYSSYKLLADKAHDYVLENYSISNYAQEWDKTIEELCKYQKSI